MSNEALSQVPTIVTFLPTVGVAILAIVGTWLSARTPKSGAKKQSQIDQLQEDVSELRTYVQTLDAVVIQQRSLMNTMSNREFVYRNYIWVLNKHIMDGKPPPAPAPPEGLLDYL